MNKLTVGSLFSGIGGFDLGLYWTGGFETIWMVEIDEFCQKVLKKHAPIYWPNAKFYKDIKDVSKENLISSDVIVGGFPCQPFSQAGKRKGSQDERAIWGEYARIIDEIRPRWVVGENVSGLLTIDNGEYFGEILRNLAQIGYDAEWCVLSARQFGFPHLRERVIIVAYPNTYRLEKNTNDSILCTQALDSRESRYHCPNGRPFVFSEVPKSKKMLPQPNNLGMAHGLYPKLDKNRIGALGNSIIPDLIEWIGRRILQLDLV